METKTVKFVANITYSGSTFTTQLIVEYKHTGKQWFYKKPRQKYETFTENEQIAIEKINQGLTVRETNGYYYIDRIAIPNINAKGERDIWYITNHGDTCKINKISKYGRNIHKQLTENQYEKLT